MDLYLVKSWLNVYNYYMTLWEQIVYVSSYTIIGVRRAVMILFTHHPCKPAGVARQFTMCQGVNAATHTCTCMHWKIVLW